MTDFAFVNLESLSALENGRFGDEENHDPDQAEEDDTSDQDEYMEYDGEGVPVEDVEYSDDAINYHDTEMVAPHLTPTSTDPWIITSS